MLAIRISCETVRCEHKQRQGCNQESKRQRPRKILICWPGSTLLGILRVLERKRKDGALRLNVLTSTLRPAINPSDSK